MSDTKREEARFRIAESFASILPSTPFGIEAITDMIANHDPILYKYFADPNMRVLDTPALRYLLDELLTRTIAELYVQVNRIDQQYIFDRQTAYPKEEASRLQTQLEYYSDIKKRLRTRAVPKPVGRSL